MHKSQICHWILTNVYLCNVNSDQDAKHIHRLYAPFTSVTSNPCLWQPPVYWLLKKRKNSSSDTEVCSGILCLLLPARLSSHSAHLSTLLLLIFLLSPSSDVSLPSLTCGFPHRLTLSSNSSPVAPAKTDFLCSCFSCINSCFVLPW